jgi:ABC-type bacteriocin/lantibiotic exporter with double-glycine peptidase domain
MLTMIKGTKSNPYGDKTYSGHYCRNCYKNRVKRRSKILLGFSLGLLVLSIVSFGLSFFVNLFVTDLLEEQYFSILELFFQMGVIFIVFALVMTYIRSREIKKMKEKIRLIKY